MNNVRNVVGAFDAVRIIKTVLAWFADMFAFLKTAFHGAIGFINGRPPLLRAGIWLLIGMGCLGVVVSLAMAIKREWNSRLRDEQRKLCYSYFSGSRTSIVRGVRYEYFNLLFSNLWNKLCIYYWVYHFGELTPRSRMIGTFASAAYLALGVVAVIEFIIKIVVGLLLAMVLIPAELIVYFAAKVINLIMHPIASAVSKAQLKTQHCLDCYSEFKKPIMKCPGCNTEHKYISPGQYGLFWGRCTCGKRLQIMPRHQQKYSFECPTCKTPIVANRNRQTFIGVVAGKGAWESTFGCDLRRDLDAVAARERTAISVAGTQKMISLTDPANSSLNCDPTEAESVALCCERRFEHLTTSLVLHALPAQRILNDDFSKSPVLIGQLDGIVFIIDVTKKPVSIEDQPGREMEEIISLFIQNFYTMKGMRVNRLSSVNAAIVTLADSLPAGVSSENGDRAYCEQLLNKHGYGHTLAQIQSAFKNIGFYAADKSAADAVFGPKMMSGMMAWLTKGSKDAAGRMLAKHGSV